MMKKKKTTENLTEIKINNLENDIKELKIVVKNLVDTSKKVNTIIDKFAKQREWIGSICWFWNEPCIKRIGILRAIHEALPLKFQNDRSEVFRFCEPLKSNDVFLYENKDENEDEIPDDFI